MKHESLPTVRQTWTEFSGDIQENVNETLDELDLEIDLANARLAHAYENDPDEAGEIAAEIVEYLDEKWGYTGDVFMVTGTWYYPEAVMSLEGVLCRHEKTEAFNVVSSNGFIVAPLEHDEDEVPRVGLSFVAATAALSTPYLQGPIQFLAFAEPNEISLQFMRPGSHAVVSSSTEEVTSALSTADALLYAYINHEGTTFFRQNAKRQGAFLRSVIDSVDAVLPAPDSLDRVIMTGSKTSSLFFRDTVSGEIYSSESNEADEGVDFEAEMLGVTLVDALENGYDKKYDSPAEMATFVTGLCAILRPISIKNIDLSEHGDPDLIVPLRAIQDPTVKVI